MKKVCIFTKRTLVALAFAMGIFQVSQACNLSDVSLLTLTPGPGSDTTISLRVCFGGGVTGTSNGADGDTRTFSFGWYDSQPGFAVQSWTPGSVTGSFTGCTMPSVQTGPLGAPFFTQDNVFFTDPGYYGYEPCFSTPFQCITSTALCGNEAAQCITFSFVVNQVPDSMRVFGVEGGGNAIAGCYPEDDMVLIFGTLPLDWYSVNATTRPSGIEVSWTTANEVDVDFFAVERSFNGGPFEVVGTVDASGQAGKVTSYSILDNTPYTGANLYRVVEYSKTGANSTSPLAEAVFGNPSQLAWTTVGPNPVHDRISVGFVSPRASAVELNVINISGQVVASKNIDAKVGGNEVEFDLAKVEAGIYFIRLSAGGSALTYKIVKD